MCLRLKYETEIKAGKFVLIVSGTEEEIAQAQQIVQTAGREANESVAV